MPLRIDLYSQGVEILKKLIDRAEDLGDLFDLPAEAFAGSAKISVTAGKHALIDNHKGVLAFSDSQVLVSCARGRLAISGSSLRLDTMSASQLLVSGKIQRVEWE